jgi:hypothetical protein
MLVNEQFEGGLNKTTAEADARHAPVVNTLARQTPVDVK